jgi:putative DNA primase/helicase
LTSEHNPKYYLDHLKSCIERFENRELGTKPQCNAYADYWRYYVGVNIIPAYSIGKKPSVEWKEYQNVPIPESIHEKWKKEGRFIAGSALIMGKIWHRPDLLDPEHFLVGIDADNQLAIIELLTMKGRTRTIEQFSRVTVVEQYENGKDRMHFYVYTIGGQLRNKSSDKANNKDFEQSKLPSFEVKATSKFLMYPSPNGNKEGFRRKILGTFDPVKLDNRDIIHQMQNHIDEVCNKYGLVYSGGESRNQIPIQELFKVTFVVYEGHNRHQPLLRVMESLITRNRGIISETEIMQMARQWNDTHCKPPLDEKEFQKQWRDAIHFLKTSVEHFLGAEQPGDSKETKEAKRLQKEQIKREKRKQREDFVDGLIQQMNLKTLKDTDEIYYYDEKRGIFVPGAESIIKSILEEKFGYADPTDPYSISLTNHEVSEYFGHIQRRTYIDRNDFDPDIEWISTENCMVNLLTGESRTFDPEFMCTTCIPVKFDNSPETKTTQLAESAILGSAAVGPCPRIIKFLYDIVAPEDVEVILDFIAYCLWRYYKFHVWLLFNGAGQNGKSTLINLIEALLGKHNVSGESLQRLLDNRFSVANLFHKLANVDADLSGDALKNTGILKKLTGNDLFPAENKFERPFYFKSHAKLIFSCNEMPKTEDITDAFFRRLIIINFNKQFFGALADPSILEKLTTQEELSGLFRIVLSRIPSLLKYGLRTINPATIESTFDKYIGNKDPAELFFIKAIEKTGNPDHVLSKGEVYESYKLFCKVHGLVGSEQGLSRKLRFKGVHSFRDPKPDSDGRRCYLWYGIKLVDWKALDDRAQEVLVMDELSDKERECMK